MSVAASGCIKPHQVSAYTLTALTNLLDQMSPEILLENELEVMFAPTWIVRCGFNSVKVKYQVGKSDVEVLSVSLRPKYRPVSLDNCWLQWCTYPQLPARLGRRRLLPSECILFDLCWETSISAACVQFFWPRSNTCHLLLVSAIAGLLLWQWHCQKRLQINQHAANWIIGSQHVQLVPVYRQHLNTVIDPYYRVDAWSERTGMSSSVLAIILIKQWFRIALRLRDVMRGMSGRV